MPHLHEDREFVHKTVRLMIDTERLASKRGLTPVESACALAMTIIRLVEERLEKDGSTKVKILRDALKKCRRTHDHVDEDNYYSCPAHPEGFGGRHRKHDFGYHKDLSVDTHVGWPCECGADIVNAEIDRILKENPE